MKYEQAFVSDLKRSVAGVWRVARWLHSLGYSVRVNSTRLRPSVEQRADFIDDGDIEVSSRVEVKWTRKDFTSEADFPFDTVMVDEAHKTDRLKPGTLGYVLINSAGTHICLIKMETKPHWKIQERPDSTQGRTCRWYVCPKALCQFRALPDVEAIP